MKRFWAYFSLSFALVHILNAGVIKNTSERDYAVKSADPSRVPGVAVDALSGDATIRGKKLSKRDRCCNLGRDVAKTGETCTYSSNIASIYPNKHYHQMKTSVWMAKSDPPIKPRLLQKCKPFKVFYEKCCLLEYALIEEDLRRTRRKIAHYLRQLRKNRVEEEEEQETEHDTGSLPVSMEKQYEI